jgi:Putative auto-transporter adhesin, head GIN domain
VYPRHAILVSAALMLLGAGPARAERVNGSGRVIDQTRTVGDFVRIDVASGIEVRVDAGPHSALGLRGEDNILPHVRTEVRDATLHIGFERDTSVKTHSPVQVVLSMPRLDGLAVSGGSRLDASTPSGSALGIEASGGGHIHLAAAVRPRQLAIEVSGGSEVTVDGVTTGSLAISASGAGVIALAGTTDALQLELSGGSELRASKLSAGSLEVEASGGGVATVRVAGRVHGSLSGGTELNVGPDAQVDVDTTGGASVRRRL